MMMGANEGGANDDAGKGYAMGANDERLLMGVQMMECGGMNGV